MGERCPIAVVGLACRFPGSASNAANFWELLRSKKSAFSKPPSSRYNADAFHHPSDKLNTLNAPGGHFIEHDLAAFDAPFFNITAQEAMAMDPTARMLLEVTYEALENGGFPIENLQGSATSCYVGCFTRDFHEMLMRDPETSPQYAGTGTGFSLLSNRVSWFYDFRGPSLTLDTACSSSLVGMHLACQSLRDGEAKMAVVCGANLILSPDLAMWLGNLHMTSKDGLSRSFADEVTGYGRGEGIAALILKPLKDALVDGDSIRAIIRSTGVNQDGHTAGITLPNSDAQGDLIRSTYASAGLDFADTAFFEAHGTGTAVGDPLELAAVAHTLSKERQPGSELIVGSVKSNIGHLEGAAGLAGVIKCILMLENRTIVPNIHFEKPNRRIPFDKWKLKVPTSVSPWPAGRTLRASVNSFGYGGTNAHAILDGVDGSVFMNGCTKDCHEDICRQHTERSHGLKTLLFVFSAADETALRRIHSQYANYASSRNRFLPEQEAKGDEESSLQRLALTLSNRRSKLGWKSYVTGSSMTEIYQTLTSSPTNCFRSSKPPRIAFVFTGQGAQWAQMGVELLVYPVFQSSVAEADSFLQTAHDSTWSVLEELQKPIGKSNMHRAEISQPMCTILQIALMDLLRWWNIEPAGVVGHSSGEIAAAVCHGALSRQDAWTIAYWRGKLCAELSMELPDTLKGAMMAAGLSRDAADEYIKTVEGGKIVVACVNSPMSVTISGDEIGIDDLHKKLAADEVFCRKLQVDNAYHSHHMLRVSERYRARLQGITSTEFNKDADTTAIKMASSVTGDLVAHHTDLGPEYWVKNLVSPVLFSDAVGTLLSDTSRRHRRRRGGLEGESAFDLLVEIGPHGALKGPLRQIIQHYGLEAVGYQSILTRGEDAVKTAMKVAGELYIHGVPVSIQAVNNVYHEKKHRPLVSLPSYPWNHSLRYWGESRVSQNYRFRKHGRHDLLGALVPDCTAQEPRWRNILRISEQPWVADHVIHSDILYPASGTIAMAVEAVLQIADSDRVVDTIVLQDVKLDKAIVIPDSGKSGTEMVLQLRERKTNVKQNDSRREWDFSVYSCQLNDNDLQETSSGSIYITYRPMTDHSWSRARDIIKEAVKQEYIQSKALCTRTVKTQDFYTSTNSVGLQYGPLFQDLDEILSGKNRCCTVIKIPDTKASMPVCEESPHLIHPTTLDVIFHSMFAAFGDGGVSNAAIPIAFESIKFFLHDFPSGSGSRFSGFCKISNYHKDPRDLVADIFMSDMEWDEPKVQVTGIRCRILPSRKATNEGTIDRKNAPFGTLIWKPDIDMMVEELLACYVTTKSSEIDYDDVNEGAVIEKQLFVIMDLIIHKNTDLSILQIGGSVVFTRSLLSRLGAGTGQDTTACRFSSYTLATTDSGILDAMKIEHPGISDKHIALQLLNDEPIGATFKERLFDVIVIHNSSEESSLILDVQQWLRAGGKLIATGRGQEMPHSGAWKKIISLSGLSVFSKEANSKEMEPGITASKVYIIEPAKLSDHLEEIISSLQTLFTQRGQTSRRIQSPSDVTGAPSSATIISLLDAGHDSILAEISSEMFDFLKAVILSSSRFVWVAMGDNPVKQTAIGYLRALRNENPNLDLSYLLLEDRPHLEVGETADRILQTLDAPGSDREFVEVDGNLCINRWEVDEGVSLLNGIDNGTPTLENITVGEIRANLQLMQFGSSPLYFDIAQGQKELALDEVEVEVKAFGIDDGLVSIKEFSGIVKAVGSNCTHHQIGDRVCAVGLGPQRIIEHVKESLCQILPDNVPYTDGASWPVTIGTAYHGLVNIGLAQAGTRVLVQGACCAVGVACVQLAQHRKANLFVTVATKEEHSVLVQSYGVDPDCIFSDSDPDLSAAISTLTGDLGVGIVISTSATPETLKQLLRCVAATGRFIDMSSASATLESSFDMQPYRRNASYSVLNFDRIMQEGDTTLIANILRDVTTTLRYRSFNPLKHLTVRSLEDAHEQFHSHARHGKVFLSINSHDKIPVTPRVKTPLILNPKATYLLAGGLGGLGRSLVRLLATKGARHLAIVSRSGLASSAAKPLIEEMASIGVSIHIYACDISDAVSMERVISQCTVDLPPIRGVIQSAAVLEDSIYEKMTHSQWQQAIGPKVQGSWVLHQSLPSDLDFFVMLSSISGVVGNRSQANYAAGNTYQDALASYRRRHGLTAVSVDLGLMVGIGLIAERGGTTNLKKWEAVGVDETKFHALMTAAMTGRFGQADVPAQVICGLPTGGILEAEGLDRPFYFDDNRFQMLRKIGRDRIKESGDGVLNEAQSLASQLSSCSSTDEALNLITAIVSERLAKDLQTAAEDIDPSRPLYAYGVDSLMAVEIRSWVLANLKADITLFDVLNSASVAALVNKIVTVSKLFPQNL
ncbi:hypothetical protein BGW36DRAFT_422685 [Talaromyces proteolyticus]|uniref:Polyketide synthase n=1 Tax=Talaromyces proteolyticus TaxID=1131652 RepID=A0AAD4KZQ7_9EURO|nr:uncharacterized protein BGW36DRAFT_422685 [Talaromyces proteolyticus]KAH8703111.1 hypothetical protein BGW36DRAFT_422685 [Talaromyces proteolyticus]